MKKKFHLTAFMTQKDLKIYQQSKNVDSITILSFKYFKFLNVFFKKNVDILSLHQAHDHVIHFKKDAQSLLWVIPIGWLVGWLVNRLVGWSILWLVGQSSGLLRKTRGQGGNGAPI